MNHLGHVAQSSILILLIPFYRNIEASSSTTTVPEIRPGVPQPVCPDRPVHLMCFCCQKPMPKQENLPPLPGGIPYAKSQKCKYGFSFLGPFGDTIVRARAFQLQDRVFDSFCRLMTLHVRCEKNTFVRVLWFPLTGSVDRVGWDYIY